MDEVAAARVPGRRPRALGAAVVLGAAAVAVRLPALHQPLDRDMGAHAAIGAYVADGLLPYVDVIDNKQPLPYLLYAVVSMVREHSTALVRVVAALVAATTVVVVVALGARLLGRRRAVLAGALAVLAGASRWVQGADLNTEHLLVLTGALAVLVPLAMRSRRPSWPLLCGALGGLAALTKAPGALLAVAALVPLLATRDERHQSATGTVWRYGLGALAPVAVMALPWLATGTADALVRWNLTYNLAYRAAAPGRAWWRVVAPTPDIWPVTLLLAAGLAVVVWRLARGDRDVTTVTVATWLAMAYLAAKLGQRDFHHYYAPAVVPAALAVALAPIPRHAVALGAAAAAAVALAAPFALDLAGTVGTDPVALSERIYGADDPAVWAQHHAVGDLLAARAGSGDRLFVVGADPGFYWASGLAPASPQLLDLARPVMGAAAYDAQVGRALVDPAPPRFVVQPYGAVSWPPYARPLADLDYEPIATLGPVIVLELAGAADPGT